MLHGLHVTISNSHRTGIAISIYLSDYLSSIHLSIHLLIKLSVGNRRYWSNFFKDADSRSVCFGCPADMYSVKCSLQHPELYPTSSSFQFVYSHITGSTN